MRPLALLAALAASPAAAQTACPVAGGACAFTVTSSTPQALTITKTGVTTLYQRITNGGTVSLWCTRVPGATPAANGAGSYEIPAGQFEEFPVGGAANYVPTAATTCVAASSTVNGSVEVR